MTAVPAETAGYQVRDRTEVYRGRVFSVVTERVATPAGDLVQRDFMHHIGAVGVVAVDERDRVVMIRQYRQALRGPLWELPAGLVDVPGEGLPEVAARELAEEADLRARRYDVLVDLHPSPGCSDEHIRIFLARELSPTAAPFPREHEEADLEVARFPLPEAVGMVLAGRVTNGAAAAGVLAAAVAQAQGWARLRPVDAPVPGPRAVDAPVPTPTTVEDAR